MPPSPALHQITPDRLRELFPTPPAGYILLGTVYLVEYRADPARVSDTWSPALSRYQPIRVNPMSCNTSFLPLAEQKLIPDWVGHLRKVLAEVPMLPRPFTETHMDDLVASEGGKEALKATTKEAFKAILLARMRGTR